MHVVFDDTRNGAIIKQRLTKFATPDSERRNEFGNGLVAGLDTMQFVNHVPSGRIALVSKMELLKSKARCLPVDIVNPYHFSVYDAIHNVERGKLIGRRGIRHELPRRNRLYDFPYRIVA